MIMITELSIILNNSLMMFNCIHAIVIVKGIMMKV